MSLFRKLSGHMSSVAVVWVHNTHKWNLSSVCSCAGGLLAARRWEGSAKGTSRTSRSIRADIFFAGTNTGIYRSTDDGSSWLRVTDGIVYALAAHPNGDVYGSICSDTCGLVHSTDNGNTWRSADLGVSDPLVLALAIRVSGTNVSLQQTMRSTGRRTTAQRGPSSAVTSGDSIVTALGLASGLLFAGLSDPSIPFGFGTVRRSTDDGATWSQFSPLWILDPINGVRQELGWLYFCSNQVRNSALNRLRRNMDVIVGLWPSGERHRDQQRRLPLCRCRRSPLTDDPGWRNLPLDRSGGYLGQAEQRSDDSERVLYYEGSRKWPPLCRNPLTGVFRSLDTAATWSLINHSLYSSVHSLSPCKWMPLRGQTTGFLKQRTTAGYGSRAMMAFRHLP